jgi:hypothetical protein
MYLLLTWNFKYLANAAAIFKAEAICAIAAMSRVVRFAPKQSASWHPKLVDRNSS